MKKYLVKVVDILPLVGFVLSTYLSLSLLNSNPQASAAWSSSAIWACLYYFSKK